MDKNRTLVLGASENPERYSNMAIRLLREKGRETAAIGNRQGRVADVQVSDQPQPWEDIDTVTLYLNPALQRGYYDYILSLKPRRIIFNPGTENPELAEKASEAGIENVQACTLVMLSTGQY